MSERDVAPGAGVAAYAALMRDRRLRHLILSTQAARLGASMLPLGLVLFGTRADGSPGAGALVFAAFVVTSAFQPARARLVDERGPRVLAALVVAFAGMLGLLALVAAVAPSRPSALVAVAAAAGALAPPLGPFTRALVGAALTDRPRVVQRAYALDSAGEEATLVLGPLVVGGLTAISTPTASVLLAAVLMLVGGLGTARSSLAGRLPAGTVVTRARVCLPAPAWQLIASFAAIGAALGAIDVAIPAIARAAGSPASAGLLLAAMALGTAAAGLLAGAQSWRSSPLRRLALLQPAFALAIGACALVRPLGGLAVALPVPGAVLGILFVTAYVALGRMAPRGAATRAFAWLVTANNAGLALGAAIAGAVADNAPHAALWVAAIAAVPGTVLAAAAATRERALQPASQASPAGRLPANKQL